MEADLKSKDRTLNVLGKPLKICSCNPSTGWFRDGYCRSSTTDIGQHTVCCEITSQFLTYSKALGNDLSTPIQEYDFPGLKEGDHWCLCAERWKQAYEDGMAPFVILEATEIGALKIIGIELLMAYSRNT